MHLGGRAHSFRPEDPHLPAWGLLWLLGEFLVHGSAGGSLVTLNPACSITEG